MNKIKTLLYIGAGILATSLYLKPIEKEIKPYDFNGDGLEDVIVGEEVFIQQSNGNYDRGKIILSDGVPFIKTQTKIYSPWGNEFELYPTIKENK